MAAHADAPMVPGQSGSVRADRPVFTLSNTITALIPQSGCPGGGQKLRRGLQVRHSRGVKACWVQGRPCPAFGWHPCTRRMYELIHPLPVNICCSIWVPGQGFNWPVIRSTVLDEFVVAHTLGESPCDTLEQ